MLQQQIDDFQAEIDAINQPLVALDGQLANTAIERPRPIRHLLAERDRLDQEIQAQRSDMENQLSDYQQRLQVLQLSERLTTTGGVQILNPATVPGSPISPNVVRDLVQAALIGLFLGIGLAFLLEQVDDSIRTTGDLERAAKGLPTLGLIPLDEDWRNKNTIRVTTQAAPMSATAEAYRGLRTTLQYLGLQRPMGVVQITSASANEGKTSTMANLAIAFAEAGMPVAVVGCDLRRPAPTTSSRSTDRSGSPRCCSASTHSTRRCSSRRCIPTSTSWHRVRAHPTLPSCSAWTGPPN